MDAAFNFVSADRAHLRRFLRCLFPFAFDAARCQSDGGCDDARDDVIDECLRHDSGELVCFVGDVVTLLTPDT